LSAEGTKIDGMGTGKCDPYIIGAGSVAPSPEIFVLIWGLEMLFWCILRPFSVFASAL